MPYVCRTELIVSPCAMARSRSSMNSSERYVQPLSLVTRLRTVYRVPTRVIAVDWSGASRNEGKHLWLAEADSSGCLVRLEAWRNRAALAGDLLLGRENVAIGLDFAFSFPRWFVERLGVPSAPGLWGRGTECGETWLAACDPPFWGRPGRGRPVLAGSAWRRAELAAPRVGGIGPKSVFQIGGAGTVGTGSIRGMPVLHALHTSGARIWPFVAGGGKPLVVEIYPRLLTGKVRKSDPAERHKLLAECYPRLQPEHVRLAVASEDAFDATVSALVMIEHIDDLRALPEEHDPELCLEGRIWHPGWRLDKP